MALKTHTYTVSCTGGAGVATGITRTGLNPCKLLGVRVDFASAPTGATTLTINNMGRAIVSALVTGNAFTAPKFFPVREGVVGPNGTAAAAGDNKWDFAVINGALDINIALGEADPAVNSVVVPWATITLFYETE